MRSSRALLFSRSWWRECLSQNPLLPLEWRRATRPWWRSAALGAEVAALVAAAASLTSSIRVSLARGSLASDDWNAQLALWSEMYASPLHQVLAYAEMLAMSLALLLPLWGVARAWSAGARAEELSTTLLTARQVVAARSGVWMMVATCVAVIHSVAGWVFLLASNRIHSNAPIQDSHAILALNLIHAVKNLGLAAIWIAVASRIAVAGHSALLAAAIAGVGSLVCFYYVINYIHGYLFSFAMWVRDDGEAIGTTLQNIIIPGHGLFTVLILLFAISQWHRLGRAVTRNCSFAR